MLLPKAVTTAAAAAVTAVTSLVARQDVGALLPATYCSPTCPSCKADVANFNETTACVENSDFLINCGACQQCIITYNIEEGLGVANIGTVIEILSEVLNFCANSSISGQIQALESQASRLSLVGDYITATANSTASQTSQMSITTAPTATTTSDLASITAAPVATTSSSPNGTETTQPLNNSWIVGPVIGSVLGIATVSIVIYFTRRKQRKGAEVLGQDMEMDKKEPEEEDDSGESTEGKAQLHAEDIKPGELESTEIYELAAPDPVGTELNTPRDGMLNSEDEWPLPISPLPALFAMTEMRDEKEGTESPKHETYYNP